VTKVQCRICRAPAGIAFTVCIRNERNESLFRCSTCSFCFFAEPDWLEQSFSEELNELDIGSVARSLFVADFMTAVFPLRRSGYTVLDWGGGDGLLTRLLRERGINCVWQDPFVKPRFVGAAIYEPSSRVDVTVVSEVFLHLTDPVSVLRLLLSQSEVVIMTAVVPPKDITAQWWYLMPETGQHVSFYPPPALQALATQTGSRLYTDGRFFHVFSRRKLAFTTRMLIKIRPLAYGRAYIQHGARMIRIASGKSHSMTADDQARLVSVRRETLRK
jgi:hypothetical protein